MASFKKLQGIKAVAFDLFGTLVEIGEKRRPYRQLMQHIASTGRTPQPGDAAILMSNNVGLAGAAQLFGIDVPPAQLAALELELYAELPTIRLYPEAARCLHTLRDAGYKIGLCSNLSAPYAVPVKLLLPFELDAYAWSFEAGAVKPQRAIFDALCDGLLCAPEEVLMVGDTVDADYVGPRAAGMHSIYLARHGESPVDEWIRNLDELVQSLPRAFHQ